MVTLDGGETGKLTPAQLDITTDKSHDIRLTLAGHQVFDAHLNPEDAVRGAAAFALVAIPEEQATSVTLTASYPFEVLEGSSVIRSAKRSHSLKVEARRVFRVRSLEHFLDEDLAFEPGKPPIERRMPGLGTLEVRTLFADCTVIANGRPFRDPGPRVERQIVPGTYVLSLSCPGGRKEGTVERVPVTPGERTRVKLK
jgi:hypothetical protein